MKRGSPLKRGGPIKRTAPMPRTGTLPAQSAKRRRQQADRRDLASPFQHERCWIGLPGCTGWAEHWHELVGAGVQGSRTDKRNIAASCVACNDAIEVHPQRFELGLKVHAWNAVVGEDGLVPAEPHPLSLAYRMEQGW